MPKISVSSQTKAAGPVYELRHRPSIQHVQHVLRWLNYHARPAHHTNPGTRPPAAPLDRRRHAN
jgi:hypothetical protein